MLKKVIVLGLCGLLFSACQRDDFTTLTPPVGYDDINGEIKENVEKVFGVTFDPEQDWKTTTAGEVVVNGLTSDVKKVKVISQILEADGETSMKVLNETTPNGSSSVKLYYDAPSNNVNLFIATVNDKSMKVTKVVNNVVSIPAKTVSRRAISDYILPSVQPVIASIEESYASKRHWVDGEMLYMMDDYTSQKMTSDDYDDSFKDVFRAIIFSYFKNGKTYNNLPLVQESGLYNEKAYPFTTGDDPIIVTPVYKRDGAGKYGNEVYNSDLYYYYYKGNITQSELEMLPKYKAIPLNQCFTDDEDDIIGKRGSYALIYWGDGVPTVGTTGSYQFPEGYSIGFMVRAKTTVENKKKQGELYGDGRLNSHINTNTNYNFKGSKLGPNDPRLAWITVEDKMLFCFESGTDTDFNDVIFELEGGVIPIINIPEMESNFYTFCFEDTYLGDYDMNDVVIQAKRLNDTTVEYSVIACGAYDELFINGINGNKINNTTEVHSMFNAGLTFINTVPDDPYHEPIVEQVTVASNFSFLNDDSQPFIYNKTKNRIVKVSRKGEDPHGIMIPYDFKYPIEKICIKNAYLRFNEWGQNKVVSTDWYKYPEENLIYTH